MPDQAKLNYNQFDDIFRIPYLHLILELDEVPLNDGMIPILKNVLIFQILDYY